VDDFARFPARVQFSDGRLLRKAAVVVHGGRARVAEVAGDGVDVLLDRADVRTVERLPDRTTLVTFDDDATIRVGKGQGCSCGSPLKTWYSMTLREAAAS
jgi:hypothetical protein